MELQSTSISGWCPSEPATFVQRLPNVSQMPWTFGFGTRWVVVGQTSLIHWGHLLLVLTHMLVPGFRKTPFYCQSKDKLLDFTDFILSHKQGHDFAKQPPSTPTTMPKYPFMQNKDLQVLLSYFLPTSHRFTI